jgi:hypothetical protein
VQTWEERTARNEALWREVNDRIDELDETMRVLPDDTRLLFHCECGQEGCTKMISLTPAEYREVRSDVDRFAVYPGHEQIALERTIKRTERYVLVDKRPAVEPFVGGDGLPDSGA